MILKKYWKTKENYGKKEKKKEKKVVATIKSKRETIVLKCDHVKGAFCKECILKMINTLEEQYEKFHAFGIQLKTQINFAEADIEKLKELIYWINTHNQINCDHCSNEIEKVLKKK